MKFLVTHHVRYEVEADNSASAETLVRAAIRHEFDRHESSSGTAKIHDYYWFVEAVEAAQLAQEPQSP